MKRRDALTGLGLLAWGTAQAAPAAGDTVAWPDVALLDGSAWGAKQAAGKAVVVVFWSTTCPFCKRHNAHLERLRQAADGLPLEIITIARDGDSQAVQRTMARHGWSFAVTLDQMPMRSALSTRNMMPLTVTVDRQGRLKQVIPGEMFEDDVMGLLKLAA